MKKEHREVLGKSPFPYIKYDLAAGLVVFLVALPLCLGVAYASGVPSAIAPISGLIAGVVGGMIVSLISSSNLSVSGPAAGLTSIVAAIILDLDNDFETFLFVVVCAGLMQIAFGFLKTGVVSRFFPSSVIKGMLAAIGFIMIFKQIPHAIGYDLDFEGDLSFIQEDKQNTFTEIARAIERITPGAAVISLVSLMILILWDKFSISKKYFVPGPLVVVVLGILLNYLFGSFMTNVVLDSSHLVQDIPSGGLDSLWEKLTFPDFSVWQNGHLYVLAFKIALVASLESLLALEAVDKLDPYRRKSSPNLELKAQGIGNTISGLLGGIPITSVVVRSSANADSGARTYMSSFFHGVFLLLCVLLIPNVINLIPLSALAAILLLVGYKLTKVGLFKEYYQKGIEQFLPFIVTFLAIIFSDLLLGIGIGMSVALFFILRRNVLNPYQVKKQEMNFGVKMVIDLAEEVSFLNKARIVYRLNNIPNNAQVLIDGSKSRYVDPDVLEAIEDFKLTAPTRNIKVEILDVNDRFETIEQKDVERTPQQEYDKLFANNVQWVNEKTDHDKEFFKKLSMGQAPKYLFIGCSDSRVVANEMTGTEPGEMFVHRNIANLVVHTDMNLMSVLQYSVQVLKVKHVIVCGHFGCGGVKAAVDGKHHGLIDSWLRNIKNVYRTYKTQLDDIQDEEARHRELVKLVVREQVYNLCMTDIIQEAWKNGNPVQVHGWVYDISEGYLQDLDVDLDKDFKDYELYKYNFKA